MRNYFNDNILNEFQDIEDELNKYYLFLIGGSNSQRY